VGIDDNYLYGVTAVSPTDIWAVGYYCPGSCSTSPSQTLVEHWDGSVWSGVVSPNAGTGSNSLLSVTAANASNVWAVGSYQVSGVDRTLIMRWDGSAWTVVPSPNMGTGRNLLNSVDFTSINDGWAVGMYINGGVGQTLVEGWNGSAWSVVASPNSGTELNTLNGVSALSLTDTWAVGTYFSSGIARTLTLHWNGAAWSVVTSPSVGTEPNFLTGVTALAPGNAWAVGYYFINGSVTQTLIEHWTGSAWSVVPSPNVGTGANFLRGVAGSGVNDVWAVGYYCSGACGTGSPYQTLVEHWDGSAWTVSSSPNVGTGYNYLLGVVAPTSSETWAVGYYRNAGSIYRTLALRRFGVACPTVTTTPTVTPSRTPTRTPSVTRTGTQSPVATATTTPTPTITTTGTQTPGATETAAVTASPTTCAMSFSDVQPSDYFYEAVRYLYCAGVISGYSDGTFRPYNNTIRGQLSKIVVLAEGWTQSCSTQHFSDVPPSHPFYCYIETAFAHGIISGYSDGTFRPFNNVTRGQLSKIVVLAEGWANSCTTQHFSDVPPSHPFFCYVETAFAHGIISGYADGTFRPENSATRGQISKIVYQAVTGP
jgi:hypothetical protein